MRWPLRCQIRSDGIIDVHTKLIASMIIQIYQQKVVEIGLAGSSVGATRLLQDAKLN